MRAFLEPEVFDGGVHMTGTKAANRQGTLLDASA